jgi:hypothetical protein
LALALLLVACGGGDGGSASGSSDTSSGHDAYACADLSGGYEDSIAADASSDSGGWNPWEPDGYAYADAFGPVETADEALAFATLIAPGTTSAEPMVHVFKEGDLAVANFPMLGITDGLVCLDRDLAGTELSSEGDGWRIRTFAVGQTCATAGLTTLVLHVSTSGEVTLESSEKACWYEQAPCENGRGEACV